VSEFGRPSGQMSEPNLATQYGTAPGRTGWTGWVVFAGIMMVLLGTFHAIQGLVALFQDDYYLVGKNGLTLHLDYTAWGWIHLFAGIIVFVAGLCVFVGQVWARTIGVLVALLSAIINVGFLAAYPIWSTMMVVLDVLIIWALVVHGGELRE
jgi:uncharacterized membrane protein